MKPVILAFVAYYLPGFRGGGPTRSVANMVERLSEDFEFRIVTSDHDLGAAAPYNDVQIDCWNVMGKARVFYASPANRSLRGWLRLMHDTPHDLLYLNSFFDPFFTLRPLLARWCSFSPRRALVIAPRGEFSAGALKLKSWKKKPFLQLTRLIGFYQDAHWHASSASEADDIQRSLLIDAERVHMTHSITVAPDLLNRAEPVSDFKWISKGPPVIKICFLARIAPMKNLDYALRVLSKVKARVEFNIYGPKEDLIYWHECGEIINTLPPNVAAKYGGSIPHEKVQQVIKEHDLFFVPSRGENFGHVYMEALSAGVPILVSDQTPWRDLQRQGIGWDISLAMVDKFAQVIDEAANSPCEDRRQLQLKCLTYARQKAEDPSALQLNRALFRKALASPR